MFATKLDPLSCCEGHGNRIGNRLDQQRAGRGVGIPNYLDAFLMTRELSIWKHRHRVMIVEDEDGAEAESEAEVEDWISLVGRFVRPDASRGFNMHEPDSIRLGTLSCAEVSRLGGEPKTLL